MSKNSRQSLVAHELAKGGIAIDGGNPWDIQVRDDRFYERLLAEGSIGLGESYIEGWWDCQELDEMVCRLLTAQLDTKYASNWRLACMWLQATLLNLQSKSRATIVGRHHYDLGNDLFKSMLDSSMSYSCGYWKRAHNLEEAQEAKLDLICKKIQLEPGMRVLDIGCGWGGFAQFAAERYKADVVGITISKEQLQFARERSKGLSVELRFQDYRDVKESFDRVVSVGQFEHVGPKNYDEYFDVCRRCLGKKGMMLLHTIGGNQTTRTGEPWMRKYIFPNGHIPSIQEIGRALEKRFVMEDWHNFGADYDKTLMAWFENFDANWKGLEKHYGDKFYRMWTYYLKGCAGAFRARTIQLWQLVLSPFGEKGGYSSHR